MKKRFLVTVLAAAMALSIVACGKKEEMTTQVTTEMEATVENLATPDEATASDADATASDADATSGDSKATRIEDAESESDVSEFYTEYVSLEEAEKASGFEFKVPEMINGKGQFHYHTFDDAMVQVTYTNQVGVKDYVVNKAPEEWGFDTFIGVAGEFQTYDDYDTVTVGDKDVSEFGDNEMVSLAAWEKDGYFYSITFTEAVSVEDAAKVIELFN